MSQKGKKNNQVLFFPGAEGWEIWSGVEELSLLKASEEREALSVEGVPGGYLTMAFAVRDVSAAPFVAATVDQEMFGDLADLHLERSGLRVDETAGSLSDSFVLRMEEDEAVLLSVVLSPPLEGGLPRKSPKAFDISARCLPLPQNAVVLWREFGRWVFAVSDSNSQCAYFQALPGALFDQQLCREVALGMSQLFMQEVLSVPLENCQIWTSEGEFTPSEEAMQSLGKILGLSVESVTKPAPLLPNPVSSLLPADIRAERVAKQKARQAKLAIAAGVLLYVGLLGFLAYQYFDTKQKTELAQQRAENSNPAAEQVMSFKEKWDEIQPVVENQVWPIEQYYNAYLAAPKKGLKLATVEAHNEIKTTNENELSLARFITLIGESEEVKEAIQFGENLEKSQFFKEKSFNWEITSPTPTSKGTWRFNYTATAL